MSKHNRRPALAAPRAAGMARRSARNSVRARLTFEPLESRQLLSVGAVISEFMAVNHSTLADADGEFSDWIEIHNTSVSPVDLSGWSLTDDATNLGKWHFPAVTLAADGYLTVFASGKDRRAAGNELHTNFQLNGDGEYLALVETDGTTIATAFDPYPTQHADVSYGTAETTAGALVPVGTAAKTLIPTSDALGLSWTGGAPFNDSAWTSGTTAVGYDTSTVPLPVAYWNFNETSGDAAADITGHGHNATLSGDLAWSGMPSGGLNFDGSGDYVTAPIDVSETAMTVSLWFKTTTPDCGVFQVADGTLGANGYDRLLYLTGGNLAARLWSDETIVTTGLSLADGQWHHLAYEFGGSVGPQRLFIDGTLRVTGTKNYSDFNWQSSVVFGFAGDQSAHQFYQGAIDEAAIWNDALSAAQIQAIAQGTSPLSYEAIVQSLPVGYWRLDETSGSTAADATENGHPGSVLGEFRWTSGKSGNALILSGSNGYIDAPLNMSESAGTISLWFKTASSSVGLFEASDGSGSRDRSIYLTNGNIGVYLYNSESIASSGMNLADNQWHHLAYTYGGAAGGQTIFVDGILRASGSKSQSDFNWDNRVYIGYSGIASQPHFQGTIDDVAIWNTGLTAPQVLALVQGRSPLTTDALIGTNVKTAMYTWNSSAYMRAPFMVSSTDAQLLRLNMNFDDGYVAWINGVEIARRNAPATLAYNSAATAGRTESDGLTSDEVEWTIPAGVLHTGTNILAIQGLTTGKTASAFFMRPELLHLQVVPDRYMLDPTPSRHNLDGIIGFAGDTKFSVDRGFYDTPFSVAISTDTPGATIRYTLDGSAPTATSGNVYSAPLTVSNTTILRAAAFLDGYQPGNIDTQTYVFVNDVISQPTMSTIITNDPVWGPQMRAALLAIPTVSLVTDAALVSGSETKTSMELLNPDGSKGFQIYAGAELFGNASLVVLPKKQIRVSFKGIYGATKLNFDVFGEGATQSFDNLILRGESFDSPFYPNGTDGSYLRSTMTSYLQAGTGNLAPHERFVHLYINGEYRGEYSLMERTDAPFMASYLGGSKEDYDAIHADYPVTPIDGDAAAWNAMVAATTSGDYQQVQQWMDVQSYADYMLLEFYVANTWDWNAWQNWMAGRRRADGAGFLFFAQDADMNLRGQGPPGSGTVIDGHDANTVGYGGPANMWGAMMQYPEFKVLLADRAQKLFFNDGIFTTAKAQALFDSISARLSTAIIAECARWGENPGAYLGWNLPNYTPTSWQNVVDLMRNHIIAGRDDVVMQQLRDAALFPAVAAPTFSQRGGPVYANYLVTLSAPAGTIYYTLDGSDPRLPGGGISPSAQPYQGTTISTSLIAQGATWKYLDNGSDQGTAWRASGFNDTAWQSGPAQLGYGDGDEATTVGYGSDPNNKYVATYLRKTFSVTNPSQFNGLTLDLLRDDGAVVYVNGQEVVRSNMPTGTIGYQTLAATGIGGDDETTHFYSYTLNPNILLPGTNTIAVEIHQSAANSSDISFDLRLTATNTTTPTPITVNDTTLIKVRALSGGVWSAIDEAQFIVDAPASITNLVVNELHYHPPGPNAAELAINPIWTSNDFEFIELKNTSNAQIDLTGVKFTVGVTFDFTGSSVTKLAPGGYVLVVKNLTAFQARYGTSQLARIAGVYSGSLSDGGETLTLKDRLNADIVNFAYSDSGAWPGRADGDGSSLELKDPAAVPATAAARATYLLDGNNWRSSREYGGTPAAAGTGSLQTVVVNEVLAHTDLPLLDAIELYNSTAAPLNIGGWYLSDSSSDLKKYRIPDGTVLAAHEYRVLDDDDFGAYFRLNAETGDDVWLTSADAAGNLTAFVEHVEFGAAKNGESFGRWPDATGGLYPLKNRTLGEPNNLAGNGPRIGPILISEVMYKPSVSAGQNPDDYEYVEIFNPTASAVALDNWHLADGVSYDFAAGTSLAAHGTLVVLSFNPADPLNATKLANFKTKYNVGASVQLVGGFAGHLDDTGETVQLQRPDAAVPGYVPPLYPALVEDEVKYDEASPWPQGANGGGSSLQRLGLNTWGHDAASWTAATPALGSAMMIAASADWTAAGLTLTVGADGKLHLYRSDTTTDAVPAQALGSVTAVVLTGRDYLNDTLTIDYVGGNPIPLGGLSFDGGLLGAGDGNTIALKTTAANDSAVLTATQLVLGSATVATYSNVAFFAFDLGGGTNALLVNNTTLRVNQDGAISAGTNVTVDGASGLLDFNNYSANLHSLTLTNGAHATAAALQSPTVAVTSGLLDATSIVGESLTIGASSAAAKVAGNPRVPSAEIADVPPIDKTPSPAENASFLETAPPSLLNDSKSVSNWQIVFAAQIPEVTPPLHQAAKSAPIPQPPLAPRVVQHQNSPVPQADPPTLNQSFSTLSPIQSVRHLALRSLTTASSVLASVNLEQIGLTGTTRVRKPSTLAKDAVDDLLSRWTATTDD